MKKKVALICYIILINSTLFSSDSLTILGGYGFSDSSNSILKTKNPITLGIKTNIISYFYENNIIVNLELDGSFEDGYFASSYGAGFGYTFNKLSTELFLHNTRISVNGLSNDSTLSYGIDMEYEIFQKDTQIRRSLLNGKKHQTYSKFGIGLRIKSGEYSFYSNQSERYSTATAYFFAKLGYK